ncbi:MAG: hypothetical protein HY301_14310 [Verrucomicrobia bacterium]|nr:hypothetical protein [Verrucomicrobiota bacterium]
MSVEQLKRLCAREPLVTALALSVFAHLALVGGLEIGARLGWVSAMMLPSFMRPSADSLPKINPPEMKSAQDQSKQRELPLLFVDVDPAAVTDAPKDAKHYAAANSRAANPDLKLDSAQPNLAGKQTEMLKPTESSRAKAFPLQPSPPPQPAVERTTAPLKPQEAAKPGDMARSKPATAPVVGEDLSKRSGEPLPETPPRPRTLAAARAQTTPTMPGVQSKQDGGVQRRAAISAVDAKGTPLGAYDAEFIAAVQNCWYQLIDDSPAGALISGKVQVKFRLHDDGTIRGARVDSTSVTGIATYICQRAIEKPSPYRPWPETLRREIGVTYREITFTFHYF